jgi:hypothetical protein
VQLLHLLLLVHLFLVPLLVLQLLLVLVHNLLLLLLRLDLLLILDPQPQLPGKEPIEPLIEALMLKTRRILSSKRSE